MLPPEVLFSLSHFQWNATVASGDQERTMLNYNSALMTTWFFLNLDGKRDPVTVMTWLQRKRSSSSAQVFLAGLHGTGNRNSGRNLLLKGRIPDQLWRDMEAAFGRAGFRVRLVR